MDKETFKEMNYLPNNLTFDDGVAFLNDFSLIDIASEHGTPLYLYDWDNIEKMMTIASAPTLKSFASVWAIALLSLYHLH